MIRIQTPITDEIRMKLHAGDEILLSGTIYTGRDQAHKRLLEAIENHKEPPFSFQDQVIYYVGPTPARPDRVFGACGPTSSYRMDPYSLELMPQGLKVMIGKGDRSQSFRQALVREKAVYLVAIGGIGALLAKTVKKADLIAYPDLGTEAIYKLEVVDFPCIVAYDPVGGDIFQNKKA